MNNKPRLGEIDLDLKPIRASLYLCKPDKTTILSLKDVYEMRYNMVLGEVDELTFTIPSQVERDHQLIDNPLIEKIKHRYLFKLVYNHQTQYFIFNERNKEYNENETISYRGFGLGYELADKDIRSYEAKSKSITEILYDILDKTNWKIGYIDSYFDTMIRSHEIDSSTVLQAVYDLAEKFNAIIVWDTKELKINMYNPSNIGMDKGLRLKPGKYLESFSLTDNSEEVVTRLRLYGKDGLTIRRLTPTGANYLEDFSYYLYPFERDSNGRVVKSSDYMSDSLAIALEDYNKLLASLQGRFDSLLSSLLETQDKIQKEAHNLTVLLSDLSQILDERDVYNSTGDGDIEDINSRLKTKESEISASESRISNLTSQEEGTQDEIDSLRTQTSIDSNLSGEQLLELNKFIIEKEYSNDIIVEEEDLLKEGIEAFKKFREPSVNLSMSVFNFLSNVESQNDHDKLGLGDTVSIGHERLDVDIKAKIIGIEFDFDGDSINLEIANEREVADSDARFLDMIYAANNTSNTVSMNRFKWDLVEETNSMVSHILNEEWDATKRSIVAGYKQNIVISERGIIIKSPENPMDVLVIQNGMLAISNNGGVDWKHAIKADGIVGDRIIGRLIIGARLLIEDENGIIKIDGSTQTVYDPAGNEKVIIGKYDGDNYGIKINNGAIEIANGLPESQIDPDATDRWNKAEENAKKYADDELGKMSKEVGELGSALGDLESEIGEGFRDGIIDETEAISIEKYLNILSVEKADVDERFISVYSNNHLKSSYKTRLNSAKSSFDTAHRNLTSKIREVVSNGKVSSSDKSSIDSLFSSYRISMSTLSSRFEEAVTSISQSMADRAESNANGYTNEKDSKIRGDLRLTAPLPTSITMNSSGITASTSSSSNFARLDYRGLYVQGGALDIRTGSSSNRGVIINGEGISGYNSSGSRQFHLDTNGNLTANSGTFGGRLSAATGTFSGNLSAAGGTFSGNLSAAGGTFSGRLSGVDGTFSGTLSGVRGTFTELSSGTINGATIRGTKIYSDGSGGSTTLDSGSFVNNYSESGTNYNVTMDRGTVTSSLSSYNSDQYTKLTYNNLSVYDSSSEAMYMAHGINVTRAGSLSLSGFRIRANTTFSGSVNFSGATVTGLNIDSTAVFG